MTPAEIRRAEAQAARQETETGIMRGEQTTAQITRSQEDELRYRASEMGLNVPEGVPVMDFLADTAERLAESNDPQARARLQQIYRIVSELQTR